MIVETYGIIKYKILNKLKNTRKDDNYKRVYKIIKFIFIKGFII